MYLPLPQRHAINNSPVRNACIAALPPPKLHQSGGFIKPSSWVYIYFCAAAFAAALKPLDVRLNFYALVKTPIKYHKPYLAAQ